MTELPTVQTAKVSSLYEPSAVGRWSGQIQFQETSQGEIVQAAHSVVLMKAEFTAGGKVSGDSQENGCHMLGIWSQGSIERLIWVDVTFAGCQYPDLNRRYNGSLILTKTDPTGQLQIHAIGLPFSQDAAKTFDVRGTLRR